MMELLAPAGSLETLRTAVLYGADAVYLGGTSFGLRAKAKNFDRQELAEAVSYAHEHHVRVHVTVNIIAHNRNLEGLEEYLSFLRDIGVDALIMADAGMIQIARRCVPDLPVHLSTQASATNYETFRFWASQGVERIVAARELSLDEIREIRDHLDPSVSIEAFVHGAMCISISGRCLLSSYLAGRDSNQGLCAHPCRWQYRVVEETRPGEYFPVMEGEEGTYLFNSKDLCMVEHLPEMEEAGIASLKIEGRMKSALYNAVVTKIYREALDDLHQDKALYQSRIPYYKAMLETVSHRSYTTGFYLGQTGPDDQVYDTSEYLKSYDFCGIVRGGRDASGFSPVEQRGRFFKGEQLELIVPKGQPVPFTVDTILKADREETESAPHAQEALFLRLPEEAARDMILVRRKEAVS